MAPHKKILRDEIKDVLLEVLRDKTASAIARAQAARQLMEMERESEAVDVKSDIETMTAEEIDAEIARTEKR